MKILRNFVVSLVCLSGSSCSLLFEPSSETKLDGGSEVDANQEFCERSSTDLEAKQVERAIVADLNDDSNDEVFFVTSSGTVFVHLGQCSGDKKNVSYEYRWSPTVSGSPFQLHDLSVVTLSPGVRTLVGIGEAEGVARMAIFNFDESMIATEAFITREIPQQFINGGCAESHGPYGVVAANLDTDGDPTSNDLLFFSGQKAWRYLISADGRGAEWDAQCVEDVDPSWVPRALSGTSVHNSLVVLPQPSGVDEFIHLRLADLQWYFTTEDKEGVVYLNNQETSVEITKVHGAASLLRARENDDDVDFLLWGTDANSAKVMQTGTLNIDDDDNRGIEKSKLFSLDVANGGFGNELPLQTFLFPGNRAVAISGDGKKIIDLQLSSDIAVRKAENMGGGSKDIAFTARVAAKPRVYAITFMGEMKCFALAPNDLKSCQ